MAVAIKVLGFAGGQACDFENEYVKSFDFEADNGRGFGEFTSDITEALSFEDVAEAINFAKTISKKHPMRWDGQPNRPFSASDFTVDEIPLDA